jgi:hypothetical protein
MEPQRSIITLFDRYVGKPALVIGGGPSARIDLPVLDEAGFKPEVVFSANEHGLYQGHFKVDYIVNVDKIHCARREPMEPYLRKFGLPLINTHSWADYRLVNWPWGVNSGLTAIAVAAALSAAPVVVVGIDFHGVGHNYFYKEDGRAAAEHRRASLTGQHRQHCEDLSRKLKACPIRPVGGGLVEFFPKWTPDEKFGVPEPIPYRVNALAKEIHTYEVLDARFALKTSDRPAVGTRLQLMAGEARPGLDKGWLRRVNSAG